MASLQESVFQRIARASMQGVRVPPTPQPQQRPYFPMMGYSLDYQGQAPQRVNWYAPREEWQPPNPLPSYTPAARQPQGPTVYENRGFFGNAAANYAPVAEEYRQDRAARWQFNVTGYQPPQRQEPGYYAGEDLQLPDLPGPLEDYAKRAYGLGRSGVYQWERAKSLPGAGPPLRVGQALIGNLFSYWNQAVEAIAGTQLGFLQPDDTPDLRDYLRAGLISGLPGGRLLLSPQQNALLASPPPKKIEPELPPSLASLGAQLGYGTSEYRNVYPFGQRMAVEFLVDFPVEPLAWLGMSGKAAQAGKLRRLTALHWPGLQEQVGALTRLDRLSLRAGDLVANNRWPLIGGLIRPQEKARVYAELGDVMLYTNEIAEGLVGAGADEVVDTIRRFSADPGAFNPLYVGARSKAPAAARILKDLPLDELPSIKAAKEAAQPVNMPRFLADLFTVAQVKELKAANLVTMKGGKIVLHEGWVEKQARRMKEIESMHLLATPRYVITNFINNTVTGMWHGVTPLSDLPAMRAFADKFPKPSARIWNTLNELDSVSGGHGFREYLGGNWAEKIPGVRRYVRAIKDTASAGQVAGVTVGEEPTYMRIYGELLRNRWWPQLWMDNGGRLGVSLRPRLPSGVSPVLGPLVDGILKRHTDFDAARTEIMALMKGTKRPPLQKLVPAISFLGPDEQAELAKAWENAASIEDMDKAIDAMAEFISGHRAFMAHSGMSVPLAADEMLPNVAEQMAEQVVETQPETARIAQRVTDAYTDAIDRMVQVALDAGDSGNVLALRAMWTGLWHHWQNAYGGADDLLRAHMRKLAGFRETLEGPALSRSVDEAWREYFATSNAYWQEQFKVLGRSVEDGKRLYDGISAGTETLSPYAEETTIGFERLVKEIDPTVETTDFWKRRTANRRNVMAARARATSEVMRYVKETGDNEPVSWLVSAVRNEERYTAAATFDIAATRAVLSSSPDWPDIVDKLWTALHRDQEAIWNSIRDALAFPLFDGGKLIDPDFDGAIMLRAAMHAEDRATELRKLAAEGVTTDGKPIGTYFVNKDGKGTGSDIILWRVLNGRFEQDGLALIPEHFQTDIRPWVRTSDFTQDHWESALDEMMRRRRWKLMGDWPKKPAQVTAPAPTPPAPMPAEVEALPPVKVIDEAAEEPQTPATAPGVKLQFNDAQNGVELKFDDVPPEHVRDALHRAGFRWSRRNKVWYKKNGPATRSSASQIMEMMHKEADKPAVRAVPPEMEGVARGAQVETPVGPAEHWHSEGDVTFVRLPESDRIVAVEPKDVKVVEEPPAAAVEPPPAVAPKNIKQGDHVRWMGTDGEETGIIEGKLAGTEWKVRSDKATRPSWQRYGGAEMKRLVIVDEADLEHVTIPTPATSTIVGAPENVIPAPRPVTDQPARSTPDTGTVSEPGDAGMAASVSEVVEPTPSRGAGTAGGERAGAPSTGSVRPDSEPQRRPGGSAGDGDGFATQAPGGRPGAGSKAGIPEQRPPVKPTRTLDANKPGSDYIITDADQLGQGGAKTKYRNNVAAIRLLKQLEGEKRLATPAEQAILVKYTGWGDSQLAAIFDDRKFIYFEDEYYRNSSYYAELRERAKDWYEEYKELKELLTKEEYAAARASTINAHYTSATIVRGMWNALRKMGLDDVQGDLRILDPAAGSGNFYGLMPVDLAARASRTAIEKDSLTGRLFKQLYQRADTQITGFEEAVLPKNYYDLTITNVPFANVQVYDPTFKRQPHLTQNLHNYFFAKAMQHTRPGGVVAFISSAFTMNAPTAIEFRRTIAKQAEFLGAIRLPNNAFRANAGTEVVTDIIFLRKRLPGETQAPNELNWIETALYQDPEKYWRQAPVSVYFQEHPEMVVGKHSFEGSMYRENEYTVSPPENYEETLQAAFDALPEGAFSRLGKRGVETAVEEPTAPGRYKLTDKGLVRTVEGGAEPVPPSKDTARIEAMLRIRQAALDVNGSQLRGESDEMLGTAQGTLNQLYDQFVAAYGRLNDPANKRLLADDPQGPFLLALERGKESGQLVRGKPVLAWDKADIFSKRLLRSAPPAKADNVIDALTVSMRERGRIDMAYLQTLTGKSEDEIAAELGDRVFWTPDQVYVTRDEYLSGEVRKKLKEARKALATDPRQQRNIEELQRVIPADIPPERIWVSMGANWIPVDVYNAFLRETFGQGDAIEYLPPVHTYKLKFALDPYNRHQWGTPEMDANSLVEHVMNNRDIKIYKRIDDDKRIYDEPATMLARDRAERLKKTFTSWLWKDDKRKKRMSEIYNDEFNGFIPRRFDGSILTFPGMSQDFDLYPTQRNAVWRILSSGNNVLLDHGVGTGKTAIMVTASQEARRLGLARKPVIVGMKANYQGLADEARRIYPGINVLAPTSDEFSKANRGRLMTQIMTGDWDAIIISHEQLGYLPVHPKTFTGFIQEQVDDLMSYVEALRTEGGRENARTIKELEKARERLETKLKRYLDKTRDETVFFEDLGIDMLMVDESHQFKKPGLVTRQQGIASEPSQRAVDLLMKTRHITQRNGGRGVVFATGTPVTNSVAELYNLQRFLDYDELKDKGLLHFDAWSGVFAHAYQNLEVDVTGGGLKEYTRFQFNNIPELNRMVSRFRDIVTFEDMEDQLIAAGRAIPRPRWSNDSPVEVVLSKHPLHAAYIRAFKERYDEIIARMKTGQRPGKGDDNILVVLSDMRKLSLDAKLLDKSANVPSKIDAFVEKAADYYRQYNAEKGTQIVFLDMGTPTVKAQDAAAAADEVDAASEVLKLDVEESAADLSVYDRMVAGLVAAGVPRNQIAVIHDYPKDIDRLRMFQQVRDGDIRILIGSTKKIGTGVNVQDRLKVAHHIDTPASYNPADIEQRNGRIRRQGNRWEDVIQVRYIQQPFDAKFWDFMERKANDIAALYSLDTNVRSIDDIQGNAASFAMSKLSATENPHMATYTRLKGRVGQLRNLQEGWKRERFRIELDINADQNAISFRKGRINQLQELIAARDANPERNILILETEEGLKQVDLSKKEQVEALANIVGVRAATEQPKPLGEYRGIPISAQRAPGGDGRIIASSTNTDLGSPFSIRNRVDELELQIEAQHKAIKTAEENIFARQQQLEQPWEHGQRLADAEAELEKTKGMVDKWETENAEIEDLAAFDDHSAEALGLFPPGPMGRYMQAMLRKVWPPAPDVTHAADHDAAAKLWELDQLRAGARKYWNTPGQAPTDPATTTQVQKWLDTDVSPRMRAAKGLAAKAAQDETDQIMLDYGNTRGFDAALNVLFPYSYWHTRSAWNWGKRMARKPQVLAWYAKYDQERRERRRADQQLRPRFYDKWRADVGALPDWMEPALYYNPDLLLFPFSNWKMTNWDDANEANTAFGKAKAVASDIGLSPHQPIQAMVDLVEGNPLGGLKDWLPLWETVTSASAVAREKAPSLSNLIPPGGFGYGGIAGSKWDAYRLQRMIASMAADKMQLPGVDYGDTRDVYLESRKAGKQGLRELLPYLQAQAIVERWTRGDLSANEIKAMREDPLIAEAMQRAALERAVPVLSSYATALRMTPVAEGERTQVGLQRAKQQVGFGGALAGAQGSRQAMRTISDANQFERARWAQYGALPGETETSAQDLATAAGRMAIKDEIHAKYDALEEDLLRQSPADHTSLRALQDQRYAEIDQALADAGLEGEAETEDEPYLWSIVGAAPAEADNIRSEQIIATLWRQRPTPDPFTANGQTDWDAYYQAMDAWYADLPALAMQDETTRMAAEHFGANSYQALNGILTREKIDKYTRRYDSPLDALHNTVYDLYRDASNAYGDEVRSRFGEDIFDIQDAYYAAGPKGSDARRRFLANHPKLIAYWDADEGIRQKFPSFAGGRAADFVDEVLDAYPEKGWTREELQALYATIPDIPNAKGIWAVNHPEEAAAEATAKAAVARYSGGGYSSRRYYSRRYYSRRRSYGGGGSSGRVNYRPRLPSYQPGAARKRDVVYVR